MSDLQRRTNRMPRKKREERAFRLAMVGGTTGILGSLGLVIAILTPLGAFWPIVLILVSVACFFGFKNTVS